jgi:hypothetical protein
MLPSPRGLLSEHATRLLRGDRAGAAPTTGAVADPLGDDDLHLALYCCYEMHYRGFDGVDPAMEWDPAVLEYRRSLETAFESAMRDVVGARAFGRDVREGIRAAINDAPGPSLSGYMAAEGTIAEMREFAIHRSAYQLKEADPHTWAIPRVAGDAKAALVHIQCDEYGFGRAADDMHAALFATTMRALGLDDTYGAYVELLPGTTLATVNLVSMFGLHRRLRGAAIGHLTVFEMTSVVPMGRYAAALTRLRVPDTARRFYDVHVIADADHEVVALERMAYSLARDDPQTAREIAFGAHAVLEIERRFAEALLAAWTLGRSSLRAVDRVAA